MKIAISFFIKISFISNGNVRLAAGVLGALSRWILKD